MNVKLDFVLREIAGETLLAQPGKRRWISMAC